MEDAMQIARTADLFLIVGTSLVVYPAAGLVHYVPAPIPKFVVDKKIPPTTSLYNITAIEKGACEGMKELKQLFIERGFF
jgi:NAD-dependent deacetylase